jgi:rRNA maturation RNase YbeY
MLSIKNLTKTKISGKFLERVFKISIENIPAVKKIVDPEIDLVIIGEKRMRSMNHKWRGKDKATDVLSFESASGRTKERSPKNGFKFIFPPDGIVRLGQIFICASVAARQAKEDGHSFDKEMVVLLVHGILHLAGYDHEKSASEARKMFSLQEKIIKEI